MAAIANIIRPDDEVNFLVGNFIRVIYFLLRIWNYAVDKLKIMVPLCVKMIKIWPQ